MKKKNCCSINFNDSFAFFRFKNTQSPEEKEKVAELQKNTLKRKAQLYEIEQSLPAKSGRYLRVSLKFFLLKLISFNL